MKKRKLIEFRLWWMYLFQVCQTPNGSPPVASQNTHLKPNVNVELNFGSSPAFMHDWLRHKQRHGQVGCVHVWLRLHPTVLPWGHWESLHINGPQSWNVSLKALLMFCMTTEMHSQENLQLFFFCFSLTFFLCCNPRTNWIYQKFNKCQRIKQLCKQWKCAVETTKRDKRVRRQERRKWDMKRHVGISSRDSVSWFSLPAVVQILLAMCCAVLGCLLCVLQDLSIDHKFWMSHSLALFSFLWDERCLMKTLGLGWKGT